MTVDAETDDALDLPFMSDRSNGRDMTRYI